MSYEYSNGKLIIDLDSDAGDEIVLAALLSARRGVRESINSDLNGIATQGEVKAFRVANIRDNHQYFEALDKVIEYFGGSKWDS